MDLIQKPYDFGKKLLSLLLFILFCNLFFFRQIGSAGFVLQIMGLFIFLLTIFHAHFPQKKQRIVLVGYIFTILLFSISIISHTSFLPSLLLRISLLFSLSLFTYMAVLGIPFVRNLLELLLSPFYNGVTYLQSIGKAFVEVITPTSLLWKTVAFKRDGQKQTLVPLVIGFIIALPVVLILISLLSSADPIFSNYITRFTSAFSHYFAKDIWNRVFSRFFLSAVLFGLLLPILYFVRKKEISLPSLKKLSFSQQLGVVIALVAITLGAFLLIQWPYVFATVAFETDLSKFGVKTYSEYVKRGFGEFILTTFLVYGLLWVSLIIKRNLTKKGGLFSFIQYILFFEFFVFLLSIFRRVYLYQQYHGWSLGRIYGSLVLLWIFVLTITLLLRHFQQRRLAILEVFVTTLFILFLGFFNIENFIVTVHPPTVNKRIDYVYLSRMSSDGYQGWKMAYEYAKKTLLNSPSSTPQHIFSFDDKRDIAYSGFISRQIMTNYHRLIQKYGSQLEKKTYYLALLTNQQDLSSYYENKLKSTKSNTVVSSPNGTPTLTPTDYSLQFIETRKKNIVRAQKMLESCHEEMCVDSVGTIFFVNYFFGPESYYPQELPNWFIDIQDIPKKQAVTKQEKRSVIDKIVIFNLSDYRAYEKMKKEFPIETILSFQNSYFTLYDRISSLPENERSFDIDISTTSPLLGSFE